MVLFFVLGTQQILVKKSEKKSCFAIDYKKYFPQIMTPSLFNILPEKVENSFCFQSPRRALWRNRPNGGSASQQLSTLL